MKAILLVEDDRLVAHALTVALVGAGYRVTSARTAAEGLRHAKLGSFDLMILDIGLPDGSGLDLAHQLRAAQYPSPFLFLTAYQDEAVVQAGIALGAYSYLVKPVLAHQLLPLVESALAGLARETESTAKLRAAIGSNRTISVAVGMLAVQLGCSPDDATATMRKFARDHKMKMEMLASQILAGENPIPGSRFPR